VHIVATSEGKSDSARVLVKPGTLSLFIGPSAATIGIGQSVPLTIGYRDVQGNYPTWRPTAWSSSAPEIATVSHDGFVTGHTVGGPVTITARNDLGVGTSIVRVESLTSSVGPFAAVTAGFSHSCALTTSGAAYCWGRGESGELGNGNTASSSVPVAVAGELTFTTVTAGIYYTCGLTREGEAYCWGDGGDGVLGSGPRETCGRASACAKAPQRVAGEHTFRSITAGPLTACALTPSGAAYCWGWGEDGQLGNGTTSLWYSSAVPVAVSGGLSFAAISPGDGTTCAVTTTASAYCWGANHFGALGIGNSSGPQQCYFSEWRWPFYTGLGGCSLVPQPVPGARAISAISAGFERPCALQLDGAAICWGQNEDGGLGNGVTNGPEMCTPYRVPCSTAPVSVAADLRFATLGPSRRNICGVTPAGAAYCWGNNFDGQLGNGTFDFAATAVAVAGGLEFAAVHAGMGYHACGVTRAGEVYCWGNNEWGQLGIRPNMTARSALPVKVARQP
jgi:alpha-tubulin suppressor-like RCC1 family protein